MPGWVLVDKSLSASTATSFTTSAINSTTADLVVVVTSGFVPNGPPAISADTYTNTWHYAVAVGMGNTYLFIYYAWNAIVGSGHTVTLNGSRFYTTIVLAYSGSQTSADPLDQSNANAYANQVYVDGMTVTTTAAGELLILGAAGGGNAWASGGLTVADGSNAWTIENQLADGTDIACAAADFVQSAAGLSDPTWSANGVNVPGFCGVQATFKAPAGGGGGGAFIPLIGRGPGMNLAGQGGGLIGRAHAGQRQRMRMNARGAHHVSR